MTNLKERLAPSVGLEIEGLSETAEGFEEVVVEIDELVAIEIELASPIDEGAELSDESATGPRGAPNEGLGLVDWLGLGDDLEEIARAHQRERLLRPR